MPFHNVPGTNKINVSGDSERWYQYPHFANALKKIRLERQKLQGILRKGNIIKSVISSCPFLLMFPYASPMYLASIRGKIRP